jgi:hypothetical protein
MRSASVWLVHVSSHGLLRHTSQRPFGNIADCLFLHSCVHEYMDVYSEVVQPDAAELINSPFGGRYCGPIRPRRRVSLYRALALAFYTDKNVSTSDLFTGRYTFINDCKFRHCSPRPGGPVDTSFVPRSCFWPTPQFALLTRSFVFPDGN